MSTLVKSLIKHSLTTLGVPRWTHRLLNRNSLSILMYHGIVRTPLAVPDWCFLDAVDFYRQMQYLKRYFMVLPLAEAVAKLYTGQIRNPVAAVTFDDGYQNNCDVALPVLQELGLPATIFINTDIIDSDDTIWFCRLNAALERTAKNHLDWRDTRYDISSTAARAATAAVLQDRLKTLVHDQLLSAVKSIVELLGSRPDAPIPRGSPYRMLDRPSIRAMLESGLVEVGAHTASHSILTRVSSERARAEIEQSVAAVAELTERPCRLFAYPNGRPEDYSQECIDWLRHSGVEAAVTTVYKPNTPTTPPLELHRYGIGAELDFSGYRCTIHHLIAQARAHRQ